MLNKHTRALASIKTSRCIRGGFLKAKRKLSRSNEGTAESVLGNCILPPDKSNREKKYKSTLAVAVAGTAIGVSHVAAVSGKYRKVVSGKSTLGIGIIVGGITSAIWYNYIDAAYDGVSEEDISMMFEMANSTGYGSMDDDNDSAKAVDILHTLVTGKVVDQESTSNSMFAYEDDEEDEFTTTSEDVFSQKVSFSDDNENKFGGSSAKSSFGGFGGGGIGKSLGKSTIRKSYLPDLDRVESEEVTEAEEGWMDFT